MFLAHHLRVEKSAGGGQWIDGRVDALLRNGALQHDSGVEVSEGCGRSRVSVVVGLVVHGLHRCYRSLLGRGDALLQLTHLFCQVWLVAHSGGHATQERRYFSACLCEAEDVVDKEQHVLALFVTEVFRQRQSTQSHAQTSAGRLIHLTKDHSQAIDDPCIDHFFVQVVAFAGALTNTSKNAVAAMSLRDVVNEFLDDNGLAHTSTTKGSGFSTSHEGTDQIDNFQACL